MKFKQSLPFFNSLLKAPKELRMRMLQLSNHINCLALFKHRNTLLLLEPSKPQNALQAIASRLF